MNPPIENPKAPFLGRPFLFLVACLFGVVHLYADVIPADRLPPTGWSRNTVGVSGGIPNFTTIFANVKDAPYNAAGDGVTNDQPAIQAAIFACPPGQVVYVPAGTYLLDDQLYFLSSYNVSVVLRGAGPSQTKLLFNMPAGSGNNLLTFNGDSFENQHNVVGGFQRGSTNIICDSVYGYSPGQVLYLFEGNGTGPMWQSAQNTTPDGCIHQTFNILAVNQATNTVTVDRPIYYAGYTTDTTVAPYLQTGSASMWFEHCGVEDLYIANTTSTGGANIFFQGCRNCWVKNVESAWCAGWNIRFQYARQCEVRGCVIHDGYFGGGNTMYGVGFYKLNCDNLVEDNIFYHCRHSFTTEYGNQGNVFGYNYSFDPVNQDQLLTDFLMGDMHSHGGLPMFNLYEGNVVARLSFDDELGGSRNLTAFRNWVQRKALSIVNSMRAVEIGRNGYGDNIVGNILLTPGQTPDAYDMGLPPAYDGVRRYGMLTDGDINYANQDPQVAPATLYHMNWDFYYQGSVNYLDPTVSDTTLVNSYYYTSKPSWWTAGLAWPAIGPDCTPMAGGNPAYLRWQQQQSGVTPTPPSAPTGVKVVSP